MRMPSPRSDVMTVHLPHRVVSTHAVRTHSRRRRTALHAASLLCCSAPGDPDGSTTFPARLVVDHVRVTTND